MSAKSAALPKVVFTRLFDAPRATVWRAWTDAKHLAKWWGPIGWTAPVCRLDARVGGRIHVVMRGPDGEEHPMEGTVTVLDAPRRFAFVSSVPDKAGATMFEVENSVLFAARRRKTLVTLTARVTRITPVAAPYIAGMEAGWCQSLEKLDSTLSGSAKREIVSVRCLEASPAQVYRAWTTSKIITRWWGPKGFTNTISRFEPRAGGRWNLVMHGPDGKDFPNAWRFLELERPRRIVLEHPSKGHHFRILATFSGMGPRTILIFRQVFGEGTAMNPKFRAFLQQANDQMLDRMETELARIL
ncbi:MAG: SRPBCC domain-containing protein [Planctomycetes bacterium]|nr:SRPBCC domain-containing protein [Planctomycetota bacterium]